MKVRSSRWRWALVTTAAALTALVLGKALSPVIAEAVDPSNATVTGVVYHDGNGNGERDARERGVRGVTVSDGVTLVQTDSNGRYSIETDVERRITDLVFISKPAGWSVATDEAMIPRFYRDLGKLADDDHAQADFALRRDPEGRAKNFSFANVADPHVDPRRDQQYFPEQIEEINSTSRKLGFVQVSGDLTNDATDAEFQAYRRGTARSKHPVWSAVGNHEYFFGGAATYEARIDNYRRYVGPEWYSFDYGNRHFVVIENNGGAPFDEQYGWVERDLELHARDDRQVVVLMHQPMNVPFGSPSQYDAYKALLERYETELILVGHEHSNDVDRKFVRGAKHIQTTSSWYSIDHSPRGFRYVHMSSDRFRNPFRMYGVQQSLTITSPAPGAVVSSRGGQREVQVNAYDTSDRMRRVRYRVDGKGGWHDLNPSGAFTWFADLGDGARSSGVHSIEVEAITEAGESRRRSARFRVTDVRPPRPRTGSDWNQFHGNARHSGATSDTLGPNLQLAWIHRTPGTALTNSPAIVDGVAYAGVRDENGLRRGKVHAIEVKSGRKLWDFRADSSVHGSPAVADGLVYVPSLHGTLYAVDAKTGKLRWKREPEPAPPGPARQRSYSYYSPAVAEGKVFWAHQTRYGKASQGLLQALDPKTGATIWESPMTGSTMSDGTPAVADGRVYVGNQTADRVIAYDAGDGRRLWVSSNVLGSWQDAAPTAVGGSVFIGANNAVIARDAAGSDLWTHRSPDESYISQNATPSAPAVVGDTLYMGFPDGRVTALTAATGQVVWTVRLPGRRYMGGVLSSPAVSGDTLYIGANNGHLYALDRHTGAERWKYEIGTWVAGAPAVSGNALVVGAYDGNLYAFTAKE
ncbi:MAG: PQQ-binding-like beta-propeller repeat protein [Actinomycetota bacterium]|nr:PQQ-binding-like beta-propeller repeat protein [Actinomycetota bacterium]